MHKLPNIEEGSVVGGNSQLPLYSKAELSFLWVSGNGRGVHFPKLNFHETDKIDRSQVYTSEKAIA